ncbi:MAG: helix-turn-helix transcriptional regulator [Ruminococcus sp.]|nr:helix-turn-helix transcriptional regulator [Ruminococcus sp.]
MLNRNLLKSAMARAGFLTQGLLAEKIGMSENTLSSRMNGQSPFNTDEIDSICQVLDIKSNEEKVAIFLASPSQKWDNTSA